MARSSPPRSYGACNRAEFAFSHLPPEFSTAPRASARSPTARLASVQFPTAIGGVALVVVGGPVSSRAPDSAVRNAEVARGTLNLSPAR